MLAAVGLVTVLASFAMVGWPFELFVHFRAQYAVAALLLGAFLGWQRRAALAGLAIAVALWNAIPATERAWAAPPGTGCGGAEFRVVTANLQYSNSQHARFINWLEANPADLVIVQEVTAAWLQELAIRVEYPHRYLMTREDAYGIGVLSRWPLESVRVIDLAGDGLPSVEGQVAFDGRRIRFLGLHTHWPVLPDLAVARDDALREAAVLARAADGPVIVLGDLNLTPDSPGFARLLEDSGLVDVAGGRRWQPTWLAGFWPLALRIDHILVSPEWCVDDTFVGPAFGSDHRPLIARLRLP